MHPAARGESAGTVPEMPRHKFCYNTHFTHLNSFEGSVLVMQYEIENYEDSWPQNPGLSERPEYNERAW